MSASEAKLDRYFTYRVRHGLKGVTIKLAPTIAGVPDRLVILPGGGIFLIELKAWNGKVSEIQKQWHAMVASLGVAVGILVGEDGVNVWVDLQKSRLAS